ncbi:hypothetical protein SLS62_009420 [Diatrype stigma]|uniref:F-box domain-containing protein n=1 Tax=Diatrype stigma TaxID=117547 RepID=A0AAN9UL24_9PEZI
MGSVSPGPIKHLPPAIVSRILTFLPSEKDLKSTVLSNKMFSKAFTPTKEKIIAQVRLNYMDKTVLKLANIAIKAQGVDCYEENAVETFQDEKVFEKLLKETPEVFTLRQMLEISSLYGYIEPLSAKAASLFIKECELDASVTSGPPSEAELLRLQRAAFLFHIYSIPLPDPSAASEVRKFEWENVCFYKTNFKLNMANWEYEQMMTIYHFFSGTLTDVLEKLVPNTIDSLPISGRATGVPIAKEDTDLGPPLMSEYLPYGELLYDGRASHFEGEFESFFDLERIELLSKGRCKNCVDWDGDASTGVPGWPMRMRLKQKEW